MRCHGRDGGVVEGQGARQLQPQLAAEVAAQLNGRQRVKCASCKGPILACDSQAFVIH